MKPPFTFTAVLPIVCIVGCFFFSCQKKTESRKKFAQELPEKVDFNYHIKPILSDRCFMCHGPDASARKADLRLDLPEYALQKKLTEGGHAFVARKLRKSKAYLRLINNDPAQKMPPPESNLAMSEYEIALIAKWIRQGAEYKPHWSFIPPQKKAVPEVENETWSQNKIDHFVLQEMEKHGLAPNEKASKHHLIRRLSLDLTGLPPSVEGN